MIGSFDNSCQPLEASGPKATKLPFHTRARGRLRGTRPPLYGNAGIHLRLPKPHNNIVYVYIRKNGCSAFKRWLLHDMGARYGPEAQISIVAKKYSISMELELIRKKRLLVLRDPVERACSLFRNKFIQRNGADDIQKNFKEFTGLDGCEPSFKYFVIKYLQYISKQYPFNDAKIDPHCLPQAFHLWPIVYDYVVMLDDLPEASRYIFYLEVANLYFSHRVNSTPTTSSYIKEAETPASRFIERYEARGELPSNNSLLDDETRELIEYIYRMDYDLISQAFMLPSQ